MQTFLRIIFSWPGRLSWKGRPARRQDAEAAEADGGTFATLAERQIRRHAEAVRQKTVTNERTAVNRFNEYAPGITLDGITGDTVRGFQKWLLRRVSPNTAACYLRSLRSVLNGMGADGRELFRGVNTSGVKPNVHCLSEEELARVVEISKDPELRRSPKDALAVDTVLLSFCCMGMPLADIARLTEGSINGGTLAYYRRKTGVKVTVRMEGVITEILGRYRREGSPYLMPFLTSTDQERAEREALRALSWMNRRLRDVSARYGLPRITTYTPRRTWATLFYRKAKDLQKASSGLGHTRMQTTIGYIMSIGDNGVGEANHEFLKGMGLA